MKKCLLIILTAILFLSLTGCTNDDYLNTSYGSNKDLVVYDTGLGYTITLPQHTVIRCLSSNKCEINAKNIQSTITISKSHSYDNFSKTVAAEVKGLNLNKLNLDLDVEFFYEVYEHNLTGDYIIYLGDSITLLKIETNTTAIDGARLVKKIAESVKPI